MDTAGDDDRFVRDAPTVLGYAVLGAFTFWLYAFGPSLALLRHELDFSYTLLGFYSALWSIGSAVAGTTFVLIARRLSRSALLWWSALATTTGAGIFTVGDSVGPTLVGTAVMGYAGTTLLAAIQAVLSDRHGLRRDQALTEANVGAGICAVLAPLALGAFAAGPLGWRATFAIPAVVLAVLFLTSRSRPLPTRQQHATGPAGRLPLACWFFAVLTALGTAMEFCLVYFGAEVLVGTGLAPAAAATGVSTHFLGLLVGRLGGAALTRRPGRTVLLLHGSLLVTAVGFALLWTADHPVPAMVGLFVSGLGIANVYPLAIALVLGAARGHEDQANARTQVVVGVATAVAPYLIGALADRHGLGPALAVEPVLIGLGFVLLLLGVRASRASDVSPREA